MNWLKKKLRRMWWWLTMQERCNVCGSEKKTAFQGCALGLHSSYDTCYCPQCQPKIGQRSRELLNRYFPRSR